MAAAPETETRDMGPDVIGTHFTWCSQNPVSGETQYYSLATSRYLEKAFRMADVPTVEILLPLAEIPEGYMVIVEFDRENNRHKQKTANGEGLREVRRCGGTFPHAVLFPVHAGDDERRADDDDERRDDDDDERRDDDDDERRDDDDDERRDDDDEHPEFDALASSAVFDPADLGYTVVAGGGAAAPPTGALSTPKETGMLLDEAKAAYFQQVSWVHLDPVTGEISPYSRENAALVEEAYRQPAVDAKQFEINLPDKKSVSATVHFRRGGGTLHHQSTQTGGYREVQRLPLPDGEEVAVVPVFQLPKDEHSIDSERFRMSRGHDAKDVGTREVAKSLECFFDEVKLPLAAFASTTDISCGLAQLGYKEETLNKIASGIKTQAYLEAVKILSEAYLADAANPAPLVYHLKAIMDAWEELGFVVEQNGCLFPADTLLDGIDYLVSAGILERDPKKGGRSARTARTSQLLKVAAAAAHLLVNPGAADGDGAAAP